MAGYAWCGRKTPPCPWHHRSSCLPDMPKPAPFPTMFPLHLVEIVPETANMGFDFWEPGRKD